MDTGLVREGVLAYDGLIGLDGYVDDFGQQLAGGEKFLGLDTGGKGQDISTHLERHHDLLQRAVAGPFADAVDGAFDLTHAGLDGGDGVCDRQAQVIVAVDADLGLTFEGMDHRAHQLAVFGGNGVADGVRQVDDARAGGDHRAREANQHLGCGAGCVLGRELDLVDILARQFDRLDGDVERPIFRHLQLVLEVDGAGGDEGVDARALGLLQRLGRALDVAGVAAGEGGHRHLAVGAADGVDGLEVAFGGHGKAGLHHVDVEIDELARHSHLLGNVHAASARLFAVAQGSIEDVNAVIHGGGFLSW